MLHVMACFLQNFACVLYELVSVTCSYIVPAYSYHHGNLKNSVEIQ